MSGPIDNVTINVQGKPLPFLVDTGAARSVIRLQDLPFPDLISTEAVTCVGVDGKPTSNKFTSKIQVGPYEDVFMHLVVSPTCPTNLLGADLLQKLRATIAYSSDGLTITDPLNPSEECQLQAAPLLMMMDEAAKTFSSVPPEVMSQVPSTLWSTGPEDIRRLAVPPVRVILKPGAQLPRVPQYPLKSVQKESLATQIKTLLENGALVKCNSPCNTPLFPVKKRTLKGEAPKYLTEWAHGITHRGKNQMNDLIWKTYMAPGISTVTQKYCKSCLVCATCNPAPPQKVTQKHLAKPLYPFQRIQIDHIQMPKVGKYEYVLVVTDMFSGWPEAYPVTNMTARVTVKRLMTEVVCRYGVPEVIESDQGPAFTAALTKELWTLVGADLGLHTPYHPQSSGKVERLNGTLKNKILKASQEVRLPWTDILPIDLYSVRNTPRGPTKLTPYEILFGGPPRLGQYFPQQLALGSDTLVKYVIALTKELSVTHARVLSSIPDPDSSEGTHTFQPGDYVLVKKFVRKTSLELRFEGPYQVLLTTPTSVKLEGRPTLIHASHCKKFVPPSEPST
ncbi:uncharacterized protein LOC143817732 [Ranitomeya variabilis]|uniref:uncharacterized protein LOC143817732 n=1 Tax=Ranitomeya variabilis TaxID=490064 RepID=UPI00405777E6